jgi:hypothetical protein
MSGVGAVAAYTPVAQTCRHLWKFRNTVSQRPEPENPQRRQFVAKPVVHAIRAICRRSPNLQVAISWSWSSLGHTVPLVVIYPARFDDNELIQND